MQVFANSRRNVPLTSIYYTHILIYIYTDIQYIRTCTYKYVYFSGKQKRILHTRFMMMPGGQT